MKRKSVAILLPWMKMGGTNKIAINFMKELSYYCDVTLILSEYTGELLSEIPVYVNVIIDKMKEFREIINDDLRKLKVAFLFRDCIYYARVKCGHDGVSNYKYIIDRHSYISETQFDCAISYHGQSPEGLLNLLYRIHANKKVVWIHGEISFPEIKINELYKYYSQVDHFFFVSKATLDSFLKYYPFACDIASVYHNPINRKDIISQSKDSFYPCFSSQYINILTVGRLSKEKGQDMIPAITRGLLDKGVSICWYLIGDGDMRHRIEESIKHYRVEKNVILLGTRTNPYCYMRCCDIYVQPSYTEGYSTTICEAGILGKAIIGTKSSGGIKEQITDGFDGLIVDSTIEDLSRGIMRLIQNRPLIHEFEKNIVRKNFEGKDEINKFLRLVNNDI